MLELISTEDRRERADFGVNVGLPLRDFLGLCQFKLEGLSRCSLSADKGTVQKVIVLPRDDLLTEELVLEEVEVFKV